ncbi:ubiquitin carboxyl-terminal hydrolase 47-like isoform X3 [Apostichopus japonicus]|uniref:ubiquitin carboxyl-terminal hydrolase 47-like isoform X3 n=1 Tax=Stichopus japonicus TaxID=307972 RepID=UPI003AB18AA0
MVYASNQEVVPAQEITRDSSASVLCLLRDTTNPGSTSSPFSRNLQASTTLEKVHEDIAEQLKYRAGSFSLVWFRDGKGGTDLVELKSDSCETLANIGMQLDGKRNFLEIRDKDGEQPVEVEEGAESGIPLQQMGPVREEGDGSADPVQETQSDKAEYPMTYAAITKSESGYVGLVNQAMTCYLNSLLQTLYMTPEFRNAIYRLFSNSWEYQGNDDSNSSKSIPYQLQRLFVQLQTSIKRSVETTELTRSFGWDSSEAWQQHDVQELCRVMFDALEQTWKNTDQADVINKLYQGQLKDYVKCQECGNESARKDFFLDIPLVIRPFGSERAYGSVEEAIEAFVSPETLDGSNQYFCEKCNKKCDAHKGLKFLSFPYLLTLQLKRFDFDYNTLQRIKLNDKMTFPEILDLNDILEDGEKLHLPSKDERECQSDSGAENEDSDPSNPNSDEPDEGIDEGIDVEHAATESASQLKQKGPYIYKLFSIMVHSGTASGGHYYAYICNFEDNKWYCFNDQQVSRITHEDIKKTFGGSSSGYSGFYFSSYSSSTNAYMLMYRKVDPNRNSGFLTEEKFPAHLKHLVQKIQEEEENEKRAKEIERNTCKIKLFGIHPTTDKLIETKLEVHRDKTLQEATEMAYRLLEFEGAISLSRCRLVKYDEFHENIEQSFEEPLDAPIGIILGGVKAPYMFDLFLETRSANQEFETYRTGGATLRVYKVDIAEEIVLYPMRTRVYFTMTIGDLRTQVAKLLGSPVDTMRIVLEKYYDDPKLLTEPNKTLRAEGFSKSNKIFVECGVDNDDRFTAFSNSKLFKLLDQQANTIRMYITLPPKPTCNASPSKADSTASSASNDSVQSVQECFTDMDLDPANLSPNNLPTPSPTGSSSTLSDDQPLDKNSVNLLGSETDSGVVSLHEARTGDDLKAEFENDTQGDHKVEGQGDSVTSDPLDRDSEDRDTSCNFQNLQGAMFSKRRELPPTLRYNESSKGDSQPDREHLSLPLVSQVETNWPGEEMTTKAVGGVEEGEEEEHLLKVPPQSTDEEEGDVSVEEKDDSPLAVAAAAADKDENDEDLEKSFSPAWQFSSWYFKVEDEDEEDGHRVLVVYLDKRMMLGYFKKCLEPYVGIPSENFKIYRVYANNQEFESIRLNETLSSYNEESRIVVKHGRALKKGEYRVKIYLLSPKDAEPCKFLFDWVFAKGMTVEQSKLELLPAICEKQGIKSHIAIERLRLRQKTWKNPGTVYLNHKIYDEDIPIFTSWEAFAEILDEPEKLENSQQLVLFTKQWHPSQLKVDHFHEVILNECTIKELKKVLSEVSEIPVAEIEIAKGRGTFPCELSVLEMQSELDWNPSVETLGEWPLYINDDGAVLYYRDKTEAVKELSEEEKKEIKKAETARLGGSQPKTNYVSPRKERALKIHVNLPADGE